MALESSIIVLPDIHGRTFWKEAVKGNEDKKIIFLGDYLDPYSHEGIKPKDAISNFEEILTFYESHKNNVTLLLGNHDFGYIDSNLCSARRDYLNYNIISEMFNEFKNSFKIIEERHINGIKFLFSHAGLNKGWLIENKNSFTKLLPNFYSVNGDLKEDDLNFEEINNLFLRDKSDKDYQWFMSLLGCYSPYRGYSIYKNGSIIWADIREFFDENANLSNYLQIVGHTQLKDKPLKIGNNIVCIDVREGFFIDNNGIIKNLKTLEIV